MPRTAIPFCAIRYVAEPSAVQRLPGIVDARFGNGLPCSASMPLSLSRDRIVALLSAAKSKRIAVLGDGMLDVYLRGDVERISPEAPVPVVRVRERRYALGGAANVVQNVRGLGAQCDFVAAIGSG